MANLYKNQLIFINENKWQELVDIFGIQNQLKLDLRNFSLAFKGEAK